MNKNEAINIIQKVCSQYRGDLKEHNLIQSAIEFMITNLTEPEKEEKKKK